ncbi:hypothetical protein F4677DRAFT_447539 [Hypoxylon crocopeplum]|nr:hypothetical protein F4677DRAFT_447539 [Hypoxylon crocopeplum]
MALPNSGRDRDVLVDGQERVTMPYRSLRRTFAMLGVGGYRVPKSFEMPAGREPSEGKMVTASDEYSTTPLALALARPSESSTVHLVARDGHDWDDAGDSSGPPYGCTMATPGPNGHVPTDACNSYYNFDPQFAPAVAVAVAVAVLSRYAWVLIMGAIWETIAFILHSLGARRLAMIKPSSIAKYFVCADVVTFIIQAVGGIMASPGASAILMIIFHRRAAASPPEEVLPSGQKRRSWEPLQISLYVVLALVTTRIIYRIAEFAGGITPSNTVPFHEEYSYALDCFPMMLALLILAIWHPRRTLVGPASEFPRKSKAGRKKDKQERKAAKKQAKYGKKLLKTSEDSDATVDCGRNPGENRRYPLAV